MKIRASLLLFLLLISFVKGHSQSTAYKTMLSGIYEKDFPLVYIDQKDVLSKAILLDTREKEEFEVSHIKGARWVGYDTFSLVSVKDIAKSEPIVVYCSVGARSQDIGKKLKAAGYKEVYNLYGGIFHWVNEDRPVFSGQTTTNRIHTYNRIWSIWVNKGEKVY
ncbi:rhodanese-like domain-containing protein [Aquiflexum sp. LQ15W]|uniref:rhodanese-like domain-containing protein n=1 Tax=Cognataquiflexum nitidum TaxID=2922272 RepID=UPI001F148B79|nr:rhodanese-like domain-containing protein [Cognataquiflexum nitidum]MCH6201443.1 rhodanese-like domain-containing protein [Cognataquiflexum nitidum]